MNRQIDTNMKRAAEQEMDWSEVHVDWREGEARRWSYQETKTSLDYNYANSCIKSESSITLAFLSVMNSVACY